MNEQELLVKLAAARKESAHYRACLGSKTPKAPSPPAAPPACPTPPPDSRDDDPHQACEVPIETLILSADGTSYSLQVEPSI